MLNRMDLYEKKIIEDRDLPIQLQENRINHIGSYFSAHWHEQLEMHYIIQGEGVFYCGQTPHEVRPESLVVVNSNEQHWAVSKTHNFHVLVLIIDLDGFSREVAKNGIRFQELIQSDHQISSLYDVIFQEAKEKLPGYKLAMRSKIYELMTYLIRNYADNDRNAENPNLERNRQRLKQVLLFIRDNYTQPISNQQLASLIHLSEYRFLHIFKESIGMSPINYINEIRLNKAYHLLQQKDMSVTQVASAVGFQDFNNFGRLFRKYYGFPPSKVWEIQVNSEAIEVVHLK